MLVTYLRMGKPYRRKDHFYLKAKRQGLRARSAFKIEEITSRFGLVQRGFKVLDLGAAPGGFLQVLAKAVGEEGRVIGIDLVPIRPVGDRWVQTAVLDVMAEDFHQKLATVDNGGFDAVISDLAPKTTGIRTTDEARSIQLATRAMEIAARWGKPGSSFVAKLFMGGDFELVRDRLRSQYREVKIVRPEATRSRSIEIYLVGLEKK